MRRIVISTEVDRAQSGRFISMGVVLLLGASVLPGGSSLRNNDGTMVISDREYPLWGVELDSDRPLPTELEAVGVFLQPLAVHGLNTVGVSLSSFVENGTFFSADGLHCDEQAAGRFVRFINAANKHGLIVVLSTFSPERRYWLGSPAAYEHAAETIARLLPARHSLILVMGDAFSAEPWPADCPGKLGDVEIALGLCRKSLEANPEAMVGVPAGIAQRSGASGGAAPLVYAACTADAMAALIDREQGRGVPGAWREQVAILDNRHIFRRCDARGDAEVAAMRFAEHVEQALLAVRRPSAATRAADRPYSGEPGLATAEKADGWISLFDGCSLDQWTTLLPTWGAWSVSDGAIHCSPSGPPHAWLRSRQRYGSFILRLQFRLAANGNSGVFVWAPLNGRASALGLEVQLSNIERPNLDKRYTTGAIYDVQAPIANAAKPPGEWNDLEITCKGSKVAITLNGQRVQDFDADRVEGLEHRLRQGVIGLQDHGCDTWFRHIRIKRLPDD